MSDTEDYLPEDPSAFDMDSWLATGTVVRREVPAWADQVAARRAQEIDARLSELGVSAALNEADAPLDSRSDGSEEIEELTAEAEEVAARLAASKVVFVVRGVTDEEIEQIAREVPAPRLPVGAAPNASEQQQQKALDRAAKYSEAKTEVNKKRMLRQIATAIISVETPTGPKEPPTAEALGRLESRAFGGHLLERLWNASVAAKAEAVPVPGFTSRAPSTSDPT